jgi:hypothetical protein
VAVFAPIAALGAVPLTDPNLVAPIFTSLFMDKMIGFVKLDFPVFLLGAVITLLAVTGLTHRVAYMDIFCGHADKNHRGLRRDRDLLSQRYRLSERAGASGAEE